LEEKKPEVTNLIKLQNNVKSIWTANDTIKRLEKLKDNSRLKNANKFQEIVKNVNKFQGIMKEDYVEMILSFFFLGEIREIGCLRLVCKLFYDVITNVKYKDTNLLKCENNYFYYIGKRLNLDKDLLNIYRDQLILERSYIRSVLLGKENLESISSNFKEKRIKSKSGLKFYSSNYQLRSDYVKWCKINGFPILMCDELSMENSFTTFLILERDEVECFRTFSKLTDGLLSHNIEKNMSIVSEMLTKSMLAHGRTINEFNFLKYFEWCKSYNAKSSIVEYHDLDCDCRACYREQYEDT